MGVRERPSPWYPVANVRILFWHLISEPSEGYVLLIGTLGKSSPQFTAPHADPDSRIPKRVHPPLSIADAGCIQHVHAHQGMGFFSWMAGYHATKNGSK